MCARFAAADAALTRVYHCPYHPVHGIGAYRTQHPWRKPQPGMILQAASDLDLDLAQSVLIGDAASDVAAAAATGVRTRFTVGPTPVRSALVTQHFADLRAVLRFLRCNPPNSAAAGQS